MSEYHTLGPGPEQHETVAASYEAGPMRHWGTATIERKLHEAEIAAAYLRLAQELEPTYERFMRLDDLVRKTAAYRLELGRRS